MEIFFSSVVSKWNLSEKVDFHQYQFGTPLNSDAISCFLNNYKYHVYIPLESLPHFKLLRFG